MGRREDIEAQLRRLEAERTQLDRYGDDIYGDGDVVKFVKTYRVRARTYSSGVDYPSAEPKRIETWDATYAALKIGDLWYVTGNKAAELNGCDWDTLVEFMYRGIPVTEIWIAIAEDFQTRQELEQELAQVARNLELARDAEKETANVDYIAERRLAEQPDTAQNIDEFLADPRGGAARTRPERSEK